MGNSMEKGSILISEEHLARGSGKMAKESSGSRKLLSRNELNFLKLRNSQWEEPAAHVCERMKREANSKCQ